MESSFQKIPDQSVKKTSKHYSASAIEEVHPFAIDVCSGVRTNINPDNQKPDRFIYEA